MNSRVDDAVKLFMDGYNCAQAVFATYADLFDIDRDTALKMTSGMGAGIGRMREVCGTVSAMSLIAGLKNGNDDPDNQQAKTRIYELVRVMADKFKEKHSTIICRDLLKGIATDNSAAPSIRNAEYYKVRPCARFVADAATIIEETLFNN